MNINDLVPVDHENRRVLLTVQLADAYETTVDNIKVNFRYSKEQFKEGVHYFKLTGSTLREFKNRVRNSNLVGGRARSLYLWTEEGAMLHCKMINTQAAWDVFKDLTNFYFAHRHDDTDDLRAQIEELKKENAALRATKPVKPIRAKKVPDAVQDIFDMMNEIRRISKTVPEGQVFTVKFPWS